MIPSDSLILLDTNIVVNLVRANPMGRRIDTDHELRAPEHVEKPARPMGKNGLWIAATARVTGATLLTTDADFDHLAPRFFNLVRVDGRSGATVLQRS